MKVQQPQQKIFNPVCFDMNQDRATAAQAGRAFNDRLTIGKNVEEVIASFGPILLVAFDLVSKSTIMRKANLIENLTNLLKGTDIRKTLKEYSIPEEINQIFISLDKHIISLRTKNRFKQQRSSQCS